MPRAAHVPPTLPPNAALLPSLEGLVPGEARTRSTTIVNRGSRGFYVLSLRATGNRSLLQHVRVKIANRGGSGRSTFYAGSLASAETIEIGKIERNDTRTVTVRMTLLDARPARDTSRPRATVASSLSAIAEPTGPA